MKRESIGVYWFWSTFSVNYFCELTKKKGIFKSSTNLWNGIHSQIILNHKLWSKVYIYQNRMLCSRAPSYDSMHFSELAYEYLKIRLLQSISSNSLQNKGGISVFFWLNLLAYERNSIQSYPKVEIVLRSSYIMLNVGTGLQNRSFFWYFQRDLTRAILLRYSWTILFMTHKA